MRKLRSVWLGAGVISAMMSIAISLAMVSCTSITKHETGREPAGLPKMTLADWGKDVSEYAGFVRSNSFSAANCEPVFSGIQEKLQSLNFSIYTNGDLQKEAAALTSVLWNLRLQLHRRLPEVSTKCRLLVRDIFHQAHDQEDYLGEFAYSVPALDPSKLKFQEQAIPIYDRKAYPPYSVRGDLDDPQFQFHSGDLMLARGVSFFSAIISQISDNRSQFSHVVFVNEDSQLKKLNTVESYIGTGVDKYDMDYALKNENVRLLVLRPRDSNAGEIAAGYAMQSAKDRVPYDYAMNFKDYSKLSCVEVARAAYDKATNSSMMVPDLPAHLKVQSPEFLKQLGLKNGDLITPDDLEIDPHFELVLDWRDYRLLRDSRHKDAILSEMVRWINQEGYKFHDTFKSAIAKQVILPSRTTRLWPLIKKITGAPDLDPKFPKKTLGVMTVLNQMGEVLLERVNAMESDYLERYKRPMTNQQLRDLVNDIRTQDLQDFKDGKPTILHYAFRPDSAFVWPGGQ